MWPDRLVSESPPSHKACSSIKIQKLAAKVRSHQLMDISLVLLRLFVYLLNEFSFAHILIRIALWFSETSSRCHIPTHRSNFDNGILDSNRGCDTRKWMLVVHQGIPQARITQSVSHNCRCKCVHCWQILIWVDFLGLFFLVWFEIQALIPMSF